MAAVKNKKVIGAEFPNEVKLVRAIYDFSVDAGAASSLDVFEASQDCIILSAYGKVLTTCTSGGSATVALGVDSDPDTLIDETAVASLVAGFLAPPIAFTPVKLASGSVVKSTIATATLTAGKIEYVLLVAKF